MSTPPVRGWFPIAGPRRHHRPDRARRDVGHRPHPGRDGRTGVTIAGKPARISGTARKVGPKKKVHEVYDDGGLRVVSDGYHRRLAHEITLRYDGTSYALTCDPAFFYNLKVTKTDITGD